MKPPRGLVIIRPTMKDDKGRNWSHGLGGKAPFTFSLGCGPLKQRVVGPIGASSACLFRWSPKNILSFTWDRSAIVMCAQ